jgi:predicted alpha/beta-hydrolase family hydrolase
VGISVARFEQPWKVAGRPLAGPAAALDRAWQVAVSQVRALAPELPLFTGGRSIGARVACRGFTAEQHGLVLSAFPLHPPGRPERSRIDELSGVAGAAILLQTERDPFGGADELLEALAAEGSAPARLVRLEGGTHGPDVRSAAGLARLPSVLDTITGEVAGFILGRLESPAGVRPV